MNNMLLKKIKELPIILGSQSPRRSELLKALDLDFQVLIKSIDESIPHDILPEAAAEYVALQKLAPFQEAIFKGNLIITADTVVVDLQGNVLGKPVDSHEAKGVLKSLSGNIHYVYTGVALLLNNSIRSFTCKTEVLFEKLSTEEIDYYVDAYQPYDKAGSYGIQEWIGRMGVKQIIGSYENVMGLPTNRLYQELKEIEKGL